MKPNRSLRSAIAVATVLLAATIRAQTAPRAPAPATGGNTEPQVMDAFTVTGSNIRRVDVETTLPVTVLDLEDLELRAAPTAAELLSMLPNGGVLSLTETNVLGADARGDNTALNLRGIGSGNTLVLVNGRRLAPHPISQAEGGVPSLAVNVNQLPLAAVKQVEVLRDGASAIYGADAAAGVVNTLLRRDYSGYELSLRGSLTEHGGGEDWRATVSGGRTFNAGKTNLMAMVDVYHRELLGTRDRKFTSDSDVRRVRNVREPWNTSDTDFDNRSTASNYGNFVRGAFDASGNFIGARPAASAGITTSTTPSTTLTATTGGVFFLTPLASGGTGFRPTTPSRLLTNVESDYYYNLNTDRVILPQTDRLNVFAALDHQLKDRLSAFGELAYYRADSFNHRDPAGTDGTDDLNLYVGANNPWNPFGSRFYHPSGAANADGTSRVTGAPSDVLIAGGTGVRPREFKAKDISVLSQSIRGVAGLRGKTFADFEWESAALYSRAWTRDVEANNIRHSLLQAALLRSDNSAFNPFGYTFRNVGGLIQIDQPYTNPGAVVDPLVDTYIREGRTELATWDAKINGTLFDFWGGRIGSAFGAEYRWESFKDWRPPFHGLNPAGFVLPANDNDFIGLSPNLNLYSDRNVISGYGEILIPIFGRKNRRLLLEMVELSVAGRYEKFSDFGDTLKPKYGAAWRPHRNVLIRGSYNESFRAPNLVQTNTSPLQRSVSGVTDPYRSTVTRLITDGSTSRTVFRQGNASLEPEESDTTTVGVVLEIPFVKGLTITADWWRMNQNKVIDNLAAGGVLSRDEQLLDAYTQAQIAAGTSANNIVTNSGAAGYVGNPNVTRAPVTQADLDAFAAFNAGNPTSSQRAPVGRVISLIDDYLNLSGRDVEGIDFAISYRLPRLSIGQLTARAEATYNRKFAQKLDEFAEVDSVLEEDGRAKWRGNLGLTWRSGAWSAGWFAQYYGGSMDPGGALATGAAGAALYESLGRPSYIKVFHDIGGVTRYRWWIEDVVQQNVHLQYGFGRRAGILNGVTARVGITNLTDEEPPIADESRGYQGGTVSAKGRSYYLEVTKKL
jgi:outer membrane receptor protein involved in Fe transport